MAAGTALRVAVIDVGIRATDATMNLTFPLLVVLRTSDSRATYQMAYDTDVDHCWPP